MTFSKDQLTSLVAFWGTLEDIATAVVLIGVAGEFVAELTHFIKSRRLKQRIAALSTLAVIVGVAGELASQHRLARLNNQLQAAIELEASNAQEAAAIFEKKQEPRLITSRDKANILGLVRSYSGTRIDIWYLESTEISGLEKGLEGALIAASWKPLSWAWSGVRPFSGLQIFVRRGSGESITRAAHALVSSLNSAKLDASILQDWPGDWMKDFPGMLSGPETPGVGNAPIRMLIGHKP